MRRRTSHRWWAVRRTSGSISTDDLAGGAEEQLSVTGPLRTPVGSVAEIGLGPGAESLFAAIDVDEDGILTAAEFEVGMWQLWDVDGDGRVSAQEWQGGWFEGQPQGQTFAQWDVDGDGSVSRTEFAGTWTQVGLFDAWNTDDDTLLTAQEFQMALAETFDADEDVPPTFSQVR